ncbi:hypothetical protein BDC45DRAFT_565402 [Circinella umbellata]|nr:hypothetical protein BDC45DRAFT_565402 [Circinella umbellata]
MTASFTPPQETCTRMTEAFNKKCASLLKQCADTDTVADYYEARNTCVEIENLLITTGQSTTDIRIPAVQDAPPQTYT